MDKPKDNQTVQFSTNCSECTDNYLNKSPMKPMPGHCPKCGRFMGEYARELYFLLAKRQA